MNELIQYFKPFLLNAALGSKWKLILKDAKLPRDPRLEEVLSQYEEARGIYFWLMSHHLARSKGRVRLQLSKSLMNAKAWRRPSEP